uniref:Uncharacterized protein n=1 Tax=Arundo donax TaxID=35708 RepID=A0A0A8Y5L2_ARUDO
MDPSEQFRLLQSCVLTI